MNVDFSRLNRSIRKTSKYSECCPSTISDYLTIISNSDYESVNSDQELLCPSQNLASLIDFNKISKKLVNLEIS